eukprot:scaffold2585_cov368-Prasinococcus_capsulatus_cf.AAC.8
MIWVEHHANPDAKPGPDFTAMNKRSAGYGARPSSAPCAPGPHVRMWAPCCVTLRWRPRASSKLCDGPPVALTHMDAV